MYIRTVSLEDDCTAYTEGYRECALCFDIDSTSELARIKKYCNDSFGPCDTLPSRWTMYDNMALCFTLESDLSLFLLKFS